MITIQLQRQGVSDTVRGWFAPCPHGHRWHIEAHPYQKVGWHWELSYANCKECFANGPFPDRNDFMDEQGFDRPRYIEAVRKWQSEDHSGQIATSNRELIAETGARQQALDHAAATIAEKIGQPVRFAPDIQAYSYNNTWTLTNYPETRTDVYLLTCSYDPASDTIRHEPSDDILVAFDGPRMNELLSHKGKYSSQIEKAYHEFLKSHNQRDGEREAKRWMTWLLSEYIREEHGAEGAQRAYSVEREGGFLRGQPLMDPPPPAPTVEAPVRKRRRP